MRSGAFADTTIAITSSQWLAVRPRERASFVAANSSREAVYSGLSSTAMAVAVAALWMACFVPTYTFPLLNGALGLTTALSHSRLGKLSLSRGRRVLPNPKQPPPPPTTSGRWTLPAVSGEISPRREKSWEGRRTTSGSKERSSNRPIDCVFNTHHHGDHTGGNGVFKPAARRIVAHVKVPALQKATARPGTEATLVLADTTTPASGR